MHDQAETGDRVSLETSAPVTDLTAWQRRRQLQDLAGLLSERGRELEALRDLVRATLGEAREEDEADQPRRLETVGAQQRSAAILAVSLPEFLRWSETAPADLVLPTLNRHLGALVAAVGDGQGGEILRLCEEGLLAVFDEPASAVRTALLMRRALTAFVRRARAEAQPAFLAAMAVTTGPCLTGWITSEGRVDRALLGPAVTLSRKLATLAQPGAICLDRTAFQACGSPPVARRTVLNLSGPSGVQAVYEIWPENVIDLEAFLRIESTRLDAEAWTGWLSWVAADCRAEDRAIAPLPGEPAEPPEVHESIG